MASIISLEKLKVIAKAKFSDKSDLGDWYSKRLDICKQCPLNSAVKKAKGEDLSVSQKFVVAANLGKPTCLACGCEIAAKASVEEESCGLVKIGQEPLWEPVHIDPETNEPLTEAVEGEVRNDTLKFWNHDYEKARLDMTAQGIQIDYGVVPHAFDSKVQFEMESTSGPITTVKVTAGCGCTEVKGYTRQGRGIITIGYDTVGRKGPVTKTFNVHYTSGGRKRVLIGKLKINVTPPEKRTK